MSNPAVTQMPLINFRFGVIPIARKVLRQELQGWRSELVNTIAIPLTFFMAFGFGLRNYIGDVEGYSYIAFISPGLITMTIMLEAFRTGAWGLWLDRWHQHMLDEYRIKPIRSTDIIIGEILGGFLVAIVKGLVVGAILLSLTPVRITLPHLWLYFLVLIPGCICFTSLGCMVGTTFSKPDQIAKSQTIFLTPLLYLGGLFFPIAALPEAIMPFVKLLITAALFDGGRQAFLNGVYPAEYVGVLLVSALGSFAMATWWFKHRLSQ